MYALPYSYRQLSEMDSFPGFQQFTPPGLQYLQYLGGHGRDPDTSDESYGTVKYSISRIGFRRQNIVTREFDAHGGMIPPNIVPEVFGPLRELTRYLLPHLRFDKVDLSDDQNIRVLFRRNDGDARDVIDIDDLSSGEKAVVSLFLPFIESQIDELLTGSEDGELELASTTALIDEPDLHLHPTLQASLVEYLRDMADRDEIQFIITTHSPTILDTVRDDELFLVAPVASVGDGNQFLQVTTSQERLETIRQLTGSTHSVTRGRPIVFVEGMPPSKGLSDQRIVEYIMPEAASWVLVPAGGRTEAVRSATRLREVASDNLPGIPVFCLVDADQATADDPDYPVSWPVAMIENLLLDPVAIWKLLFPHRDRHALRSEAEVESDLRDIAHALREDEIRLRVSSLVKPLRIPIEPTNPGTVEDAISAAREQVEEHLNNIGGAPGVTAAVIEAQETVDRILDEGRELEAFRGKKILKTFYDRHGQRAGFSYPNFVYALAEKIRDEDRLSQLVAVPVRQIQRYVPPNLVPTLEGACAEIPAGTDEHNAASAALDNARTARAAWEQGEADKIDRSELRAALVTTARVLRDHGSVNLHDALLQATVEVGLG
jgi:hypothetical protein